MRSCHLRLVPVRWRSRQKHFWRLQLLLFWGRESSDSHWQEQMVAHEVPRDRLAGLSTNHAVVLPILWSQRTNQKSAHMSKAGFTSSPNLQFNRIGREALHNFVHFQRITDFRTRTLNVDERIDAAEAASGLPSRAFQWNNAVCWGSLHGIF